VISYINTGYKTLTYTDFLGCNMTNRMQMGEPFEIKAKRKNTKNYTLTNSVKQALRIIGTSNSHDNSAHAILCFALDNSYFYFVLSYNTFLLSNKTGW